MVLLCTMRLGSTRSIVTGRTLWSTLVCVMPTFSPTIACCAISGSLSVVQARRPVSGALHANAPDTNLSLRGRSSEVHGARFFGLLSGSGSHLRGRPTQTSILCGRDSSRSRPCNARAGPTRTQLACSLGLHADRVTRDTPVPKPDISCRLCRQQPEEDTPHHARSSADGHDSDPYYEEPALMSWSTEIGRATA